MTNEINASRPFVLSMWHGGTGSGHDQPYGDHTVACVGYAIDTNTNERFVMVQDIWDLIYTTLHGATGGPYRLHGLDQVKLLFFLFM